MLAVGAARGVDMDLLAKVLPAIEAALLSPIVETADDLEGEPVTE